MNNNYFLKLLKILIKNLVNFFNCFKKPFIKTVDNVTYIAMTDGFDVKYLYLHKFFRQLGRPVKVLGPYYHKLKCRRFLSNIFGWPYGKADFFWTEEKTEPLFDLAEKHIGYWTNYENNKSVFRFPIWMNQLDWPELDDDYNSYWYYGEKLSIDKLMSPILSTYSMESINMRANRSILISSHFKSPRDKFYKLTNSVIGCDGFGKAFKKRDYNNKKIDLLRKYKFNLCPENLLGVGYLTEKILHSFYAGCVPISWCEPVSLIKDSLNPEAIVNLYGLDDDEICEKLNKLLNEKEFYEKFLSVPLLLKKPDIKPLIDFIQS